MKLSPEQQKIWGLVESFWETAQNGDLEGLMNLLHEKYVFWPKGYTVTFNKSERKFLFNKWLAHLPPSSYELSLRSIQVFKNFAIVHYSFILKGTWGSDTQRRTAVWMKNNGEWKLVGGMGADLYPCLN
jgi:ketosteroid isomerase-like protein